jgi:hypothetical protein
MTSWPLCVQTQEATVHCGAVTDVSAGGTGMQTMVLGHVWNVLSRKNTNSLAILLWSMHTAKECARKISENNPASTVQCKITTCNMSLRLLQCCTWMLSSSGMWLCVAGQLDPPIWRVQFFHSMPLCHWTTESWHFEATHCTDLQESKCPNVFLGLSEHWSWRHYTAHKNLPSDTESHPEQRNSHQYTK